MTIRLRVSPDHAGTPADSVPVEADPLGGIQKIANQLALIDNPLTVSPGKRQIPCPRWT
ncbi:hypothetical protein ABZ438_35045 [Streptomyces sp. NPDC005786]|uniref:hypothetical protein n=1 Tax=Streptomyces sp. NPDC005786 TaxID=3154891 RepID=UPI0033CAD553